MRLKHLAWGVWAGIALADWTGTFAQEKPGSGAAEETGVKLSVGTTMNAVLNSSIDSRKLKVGDAVSARTMDAVKLDGKIVIPKGAKLIGHVTQASARGKGDATSVVGIKFDKAVVKKNEELGVNLWIRAIAAEPRVGFQNGPDPNAMASPGTAAAAGSPMKSATAPIPTPARVGDNGNSNAGGSGMPAGSSGTGEGGLNPNGEFSANSRGVYGLDGLSLNTDASNVDEGSLITGSGKSVQLDGGTRLLLVAQ